VTIGRPVRTHSGETVFDPWSPPSTDIAATIAGRIGIESPSCVLIPPLATTCRLNARRQRWSVDIPKMQRQRTAGCSDQRRSAGRRYFIEVAPFCRVLITSRLNRQLVVHGSDVRPHSTGSIFRVVPPNCNPTAPGSPAGAVRPSDARAGPPATLPIMPSPKPSGGKSCRALARPDRGRHPPCPLVCGKGFSLCHTAA